MSPYFSIIIPTYNRGYCLWKAVQSVQQQKFSDWELLIVDDGSKDNTHQVIAEFQQDPRIHYFKIKHDHVSTARNFGLKRAKGRIVTYVDSDDRLFDIYLTTAKEYFEKYKNLVFAIPNYNRRLELYDKHYKLIDFDNVSSAQQMEIKLQDFFHWNIKTCGTGIFHKKSINPSIKWDKTIQSFQDWDFIMQLGNYYPNGFMHIPYVLFEYLQKYGGDAICSNMTYADWAADYERMYQKHKKDKLIKGQTWYPDRIKKYTKLQKLVDEGKEPPAVYKYFPRYYKKA